MKDFNRFGLVWGIHVCLLVSLAAGYSGGDGSAESPYEISTVTDWQELMSTSGDWDKHFVLTQDINFEGLNLTPVAPDIDPLLEVFQGLQFTGRLNGQGYALRNAVINLPAQDFVGLFGEIGPGGQVIDVRVENISVTGLSRVGGLCGRNYGGTIRGCSASGTITGLHRTLTNAGGLVGAINGNGLVENSYSTCQVSGVYRDGGLVGQLGSGEIHRCYATGDVTATGDYVGGLVGVIYVPMSPAGSIYDSYACGNVSGVSNVGGLVGHNCQGKVIHCFSTGRPSGSNYVGGLCGGKTTDTGYADTGNFWDTESSQTMWSAMGVGKTTGEMKQFSTFMDAGWDFGVPGQAGVWIMPQDSYPVLSWQLNEPIPIAMPDVRGLSLEAANSVLTAAGLEVYGVDEIFDLSIDAGLISCSIPVSGTAVYPELTRIYLRVAKAFHYSGGDGSEGNPYKISTNSDWQELIIASTAPDEHFILTETIDFGGAVIKPVGYEVANPNFFGQFDGQGFAICNAVIYLPYQDYVGLFGRIGSGGKICNLTVVDVDITGRDYVGGLAGRVEYGTLSACYATGSVGGDYSVGGLVGRVYSGTLSACYATGSINGYWYVGGLVGRVYYGILSACYATGSVNGDDDVGGLVGRVDYGTLSACYATGSVSGTNDVGGLAGYNDRGQVIHCYSTGRPSGSNDVGGLCGGKTTGTGYADTGNIWDAESSHTTVSAMGLGKKTAPMKLLSTFMDAGWDFGVPGQAGVWSLPQDSYPVLSWQLNEPPIPIAMPDVRGLSLEDANSVLTAAGLEVYGVDEIFDLSIDAGLISCSIPVSGAIVYPELTRIYLRVAKAFHYSGGDGSAESPYEISTVTDWQELIVASTAPDEHFILTETIDFEGLPLTPIVADIDPGTSGHQGLRFTGTFDGRGFAIQNAVIHLPDNDYVGLFGYIGEGGRVYNLEIADVNVIGKGYVGVLAGQNAGTISNCAASGQGCSGDHTSGGLAGYNSGTISDSITDVKVHSSIYNNSNYGGLAGENSGTISHCSASGVVTGTYQVGGLAGENSGTISHCSASGVVAGTYQVGGLAGWNEGTISNCSASGTVSGFFQVGGLAGYNYSQGTITHCSASCAVSGFFQVGGLVGYNYSQGTITHCSASCAVSGPASSSCIGGLAGVNSGTISHCSASGAVSSTDLVGGLAGWNEGTISNCSASGTVSGFSQVGGLVGYNYHGAVIHCYSTGRPTGTSKVGGLCGYRVTGTGYQDTGNFWDTVTSRMTTSAMGTGKTTAEMKTLSTFTAAGWDFEETWAMCEGTNTPRLQWQIPAGDWVCPDGVAMEDLDYFAIRWLMVDCAASGDCDGADLDGDGAVDLADWAVFAEQWLAGQ